MTRPYIPSHGVQVPIRSVEHSTSGSPWLLVPKLVRITSSMIQVKRRHFRYAGSLLGGELSPLGRLFTLLLLLPLLELHLVRPSHQRRLLLEPEAPRYVPQVELLHHENLLQFASVGSVGTNPGTESVPGKLLCCILEKNKEYDNMLFTDM